MKMFKMMIAFAAVLCAVTVSAKAAAACNKDAKCTKEVKAEAPALPAKITETKATKLSVGNDDVFHWYYDRDTKKLYVVYAWEEPSVVYAVSLAKGNKLTPGTEIMTIKPDGRSKGKLKISQSLYVTNVRTGLVTASKLEKEI